MRFLPTALAGAYLVETEPSLDERGSFVRIFCREEFGRHGLKTEFDQCSVSRNHKRGTLRGMHYQAPPHAEVKLVRCSRGRMLDVIADIRPGSASFRRWEAIDLSAENARMVYIPEGFAHGFLTLADDTEVHYQISAAYSPQAARGFRWNDPAFAIQWPEPVRVVSERDRNYPDFT